MAAIPFPIVTVVRAVLPRNAESPKEVTLFGITRLVNEIALVNAWKPIV
jgi:hypothetical protein